MSTVADGESSGAAPLLFGCLQKKLRNGHFNGLIELCD